MYKKSRTDLIFLIINHIFALDIQITRNYVIMKNLQVANSQFNQSLERLYGK